MARYREKDETDLRWNSIRRRITRELDIQIADWREPVLNALLSEAWNKYVEALNTGTVLAIEPDYEAWVARALTAASVGGDIKDAVSPGKEAKAS